jgi:cbb3-type cytochrome oxidase maturation protein
MEVIFIVLPLAVIMAIIALAAFFWAVHKGQFDDLDTPAYRAILDPDEKPRKSSTDSSAERTPQ